MVGHPNVTEVAQRWGRDTAQGAGREMAIVLLSAAVLLCVGLGVWREVRGVPMHYLYQAGPGVALPGVIPEGMAVGVAARWLRERYTFTPTTLKAVHGAVLAGVHPELRPAVAEQLEKEMLATKESKLSSQLAVFEPMVLTRVSQEVVAVQVAGLRTIWVGGQWVREESITATVRLKLWGAPDGLLVYGVTIDPPLSFGVN